MTTNLKTETLIAPEVLRTQLLRPFPSLTPRSVLILVIALLVLWWAWEGSRPQPINRVYSVLDPFLAMGDVISRAFPVEFEWAPGTATTYNLLGTEVVIGWPIVVSAVFETIQMAIIGTLLAVIMSLPISLLAARNTSPHPALYNATRLFLNFMRSIPELIWAILFVAAVGLGPFPGILALAFGSVGSLARVYSEAIEQIDPQQVLAVRSTGASAMQAFIYAVLPQALPLFISYSIIFFESNVRHATILGLVGAGGVGENLFYYSGLGDYNKILGTVIVLLVAVTAIDRFSSYLRQRFI
jgi:phosphonate transport system permease protein